MADLFKQYGIKEVADVTIYKLNDDGSETPFLFLDSLKVSTLEQTAEQVEARGGIGNPSLIIWDYNKEINITLEDALFSPKSMALMWGGDKGEWASATATVVRNFNYTATTTSTAGLKITDDLGNEWTAHKIYDDAGTTVSSMVKGTNYIVECTREAAIQKLEINAGDFPGTYKLVGDTVVRDTNGKDTYFQFVINKAKMSAEQTLTLEAEGDPSTFNLNMKAVRPNGGKAMIELIKYEI